MSTELHIIEPTLRSHDGHLSSLVSEFAGTFGGPCIVHADRNARSISIPGAEILLRFPRRFRRIMLPWAYYRLLREDRRILVSTATTADFWSIRLAAKLACRTTAKVTMFVHWYRRKPRKDRFMSAFARTHREIAILTPTAECASMLRSLGFANVTQVPYPFRFREARVQSEPNHDPRVLVAGGARLDKGFRHIVELIERLSASGVDVPCHVQVSGDHWGEYKDDIAKLVERLRLVSMPRLRLIRDALQPQEYQDLFRGAIVLQPYDPGIFRDRVSGVTLDALNAGAPIIAIAGTWTADLITRFGCGIVCESSSPDVLHAAIDRIRSDYAAFHQRTCAAREALRAEVQNSEVARILRRNCNAITA